jgi:thiol-disulfide isomerase/thioredoxin
MAMANFGSGPLSRLRERVRERADLARSNARPNGRQRAPLASRGARVALGGTVLAAALFLCASCATGGTGGGQVNQVGLPAPEITVQRMSGKPVSLSNYRGQVVLLDIWASWCGPCKQELPMLDDIASRLHHRGVEVLAVSVDQERENVVKFLGARGHWALTIAHDSKGEIADRLQPDKMPTSYIIDRQGIIRYVNYGFVPSDAQTIERRLADLAGDGKHH